MRAVVCRAWGPPEALAVEDVPAPAPGAGEVLVRVRACGVNFADALIVQRKYQEKPPLPFTPGLEVAGDVAAVDEGVTGPVPGQRVVSLCTTGGYAEAVAAPAAVVPIDAMSWETAAGFTVAYGTAHVALSHRAKLREGETLLVHGAGGGVGLGSLQRLFAWFEEGAFRPVISETLPLERAAEAMQRLLRREARGRIVLTTQR